MEQLINLERSLKNRTGKALPILNYVESSVLIPISQNEDKLFILFTRRTEKVKDHKKQISFPGGVREKCDNDLLTTALRETEEEIGLSPESVKIIGALDDIYTVTGYRISPFVGIISHHYDFKVNRKEIGELLTVPLTALLDPDNFSEGIRTYKGADYRTCFFKVSRKVVIWGATAKILVQLLEVSFEWPGPPETVQAT